MPYKSKTSMPHKSKTSMPHKRKTSMPHKRKSLKRKTYTIHKKKTSMPCKKKTLKRKTSMPHKKKTLKRKTSMPCKRKTKKGGSNTTNFEEFMIQNNYNLSTNNNEGFLFNQPLLTLTYIPDPNIYYDIKTRDLKKISRNEKNLLVIKSINKDSKSYINTSLYKINEGDIITQINNENVTEINDKGINKLLNQKYKRFTIIRPFDLSFNFDTKKFIFSGNLTIPTHIGMFNILLSVFTNYNNNYIKLVDGNYFEVIDKNNKTKYYNINKNYIKLKEFVNTKIKGINIDTVSNQTNEDEFDIILTLQNNKEAKLNISQDLRTAKYNKPFIELTDNIPTKNKSNIMISHLISDNLKKLVSVLVLGIKHNDKVNISSIKLTGQTEDNSYTIDITNNDNISEAAKQLGLFTDKQIDDFNSAKENPFKVEKFTDSKSSPYKELKLKYKDEDEDIGYINDKKTIGLYDEKSLKLLYNKRIYLKFFNSKLGMEKTINIVDFNQQQINEITFPM